MHTGSRRTKLRELFEDIVNHSVSYTADPHETRVRLLRAERKIEGEKLEQLKTKLRATANAKKSVMRAA